jgi:hypothetical protein
VRDWKAHTHDGENETGPSELGLVRLSGQGAGTFDRGGC